MIAPVREIRNRLSDGLNWLGRTLSRRRYRPVLITRYDAAQTNDQNYRYWAGADSLDADTANSLSVRKTIRERARYEYLNSCYLRAQVETRVVHEIRTGPSLAVVTQNSAFNNALETLWRQWADEINLVEKLRTIVRARIVDGEAFAILTSRRISQSWPPSSGIKLNILPIECDLVTTPEYKLPSADYVDGIHLRDGQAVAYDILEVHPGSAAAPWQWKYKTLDRRWVLHLFRSQRPGQHRGVSEITPALTVLPGVRQYIHACIKGRVTAASLSLAVYTDMPPDGAAEEVEPETTEVPFGAVFQLPMGWKAEQIRAEHPDDNGKEFIADRIAEAGRALMLPRNLATGDSSDYNFASGRLDHQPYFADIEVTQRQIETEVLDRIFAEWFLEVATTRFDSLDISRVVPHLWRWPGQPYTDPETEAKATEINLRTGVTTLPAEYARRGLDWRDELEAQANALGITIEELQSRLRETLYPLA